MYIHTPLRIPSGLRILIKLVSGYLAENLIFYGILWEGPLTSGKFLAVFIGLQAYEVWSRHCDRTALKS